VLLQFDDFEQRLHLLQRWWQLWRRAVEEGIGSSSVVSPVSLGRSLDRLRVFVEEVLGEGLGWFERGRVFSVVSAAQSGRRRSVFLILSFGLEVIHVGIISQL